MDLKMYVIIELGIILLLEMAGIPTGASGVLSYVGLSTTDASVTTSAFYVAVIAILAAAAIGGIIIGFFTRTTPENYIILPLITSAFALFASTFVSVINYASSNYDTWVSAIVILLLGPLAVGHTMELTDYFRGL